MRPELQHSISQIVLERLGDITIAEVYPSIDAAAAATRADDRTVFVIERQAGFSLARDLRPYEPDGDDGMVLYAEVDRAGIPTGASYGALYPYLRAIARTSIAGVRTISNARAIEPRPGTVVVLDHPLGARGRVVRVDLKNIVLLQDDGVQRTFPRMEMKRFYILQPAALNVTPVEDRVCTDRR